MLLSLFKLTTAKFSRDVQHVVSETSGAAIYKKEGRSTITQELHFFTAVSLTSTDKTHENDVIKDGGATRGLSLQCFNSYGSHPYKGSENFTNLLR